MSTRARLAGRGRKSATPSPSHHPVVVRAAAACSSASSRRRRGRAVAGVHGRPPTPARPQRRRRPQRACLRLRLRGVRRPRGASPPHRRIAVVDVRGLRGLAHAPLHRPPLERREPLERDGSPVREADAERGSGARAGGTRGREAPSARRTRLRLSLFARPAVRVAHDVGTRSPSPGDCSVQRRSNPGLPVPSRLRGRFPGHRSNARATCRYLPPTGKDGPERTVPSAPGTEGPEALPPLPHGCEVGLPRRETFDFRQPPHAKCRKGESHRCTSHMARAWCTWCSRDRCGPADDRHSRAGPSRRAERHCFAAPADCGHGRESARTMPSAPRAQLIGAMFAPAQIHICCSPVESLSASGMGSMLWTSTLSSAPASVAMIAPLASSGCPVASRCQNGVKGGASSARRRRRATPRSARRHHHRRDTAPATETLSTRTARTRWGERGQATGPRSPSGTAGPARAR